MTPPDDLTTTWACAEVGAMDGPEDLTPLPGVLLVSSDSRRPEATAEGAMFALDLATGKTEPLAIVDRDACAFHPHGAAASGDELRVVVHWREDEAEAAGCDLARHRGAPLRDAIEVFQVGADGLRFVTRLQDPLLREPNDLMVQGGVWFVTDNPEFTLAGMLGSVVFGARPSRVLAHDGKTWTIAAKHLLYANGLLALPDGRRMVASYGGRLFTYADDDGWSRTDRTRLDGALDNLMLDDAGTVWLASHPSPLAFVRHARDATEVGPSMIYALAADGEGWRIAHAWRDDSGTVQAAATVVSSGGALWIGEVFDPGVVRCARR